MTSLDTITEGDHYKYVDGMVNCVATISSTAKTMSRLELVYVYTHATFVVGLSDAKKHTAVAPEDNTV
ncbi:MAG: hypothetical protein Q4P66_00735 [Actinomycetaceae bacterium]|nr:hypothetical protein [Actinomycetaceae bacterium]